MGVPVVPPVYCSTAIASGVIAGRSIAAVIGEQIFGSSTSLAFRPRRPTAASFARCVSLNPTDFSVGRSEVKLTTTALSSSAALKQRLDLVVG